MKQNKSACEREEYLQFLQTFYVHPSTPSIVPQSTKKLKEYLFKIVKTKVGDDNISGRLIDGVLKKIELQPLSSGQFLTCDAFVRKEAAKILSAFAADTRQWIEDNVTFGSFPLPDLNGICVKAPNDGYLVILNLGTLAFCEILANLLTALTAFESSERRSESNVSWDDSADLLLEILKTFPNFSEHSLNRYSQFRTILGSINRDRGYFSASLGDALTDFVIAHEIAHFVRGHLNISNVRRFSIGEPSIEGTTVDALQYQRLQEHEADVLGSATLVISAENLGSQLDAIAAMIATQVFFLALELVEDVQHIQSPTHPPARERRQHLLRELDYRNDVLQAITVYDESLFMKAKAKWAGSSFPKSGG